MIFLDDEFLLRNLWWVILLALICLAGIVILLSYIVHKKKKEPTHVVNISDNLQAIGGKDNVLSHSLSGSRIILHLKDYSKVEREKLKKAGAIGFIMKSDKLTIVFKENAKDVYQNLFKE